MTRNTHKLVLSTIFHLTDAFNSSMLPILLNLQKAHGLLPENWFLYGYSVSTIKHSLAKG